MSAAQQPKQKTVEKGADNDDEKDRKKEELLAEFRADGVNQPRVKTFTMVIHRWFGPQSYDDEEGVLLIPDNCLSAAHRRVLTEGH